jgi:hypothetical protein
MECMTPELFGQYLATFFGSLVVFLLVLAMLGFFDKG